MATVGTLEIELMASLARLNSDMDKAKRTVSDTVAQMNNVLATIGVGVSLAGITSMIRSVADAGDKLNDLSKITGLAVTELGGLEKAAKLNGTSLDSIAKAVGVMSKNMFDGSEAFKTLGINVKDTTGQLRNTKDVFLEVADRFSRAEDGAAKAAIAQEVFGKSGRELIPLLNEGRDSLQENIDAYAKYSGMSQEAAEASDQFNDTIEILHGRVNAIKTSFVAELLPTLNNIGAAMIGGAQSTNEFSFAAQVVVPVLKGLAIAGFTVVDTFRGMGREIGARAAQLTALAQMDFKGASFIGEELAKDNAKSREEFDKFVETILNGDKALNQMADGGAKKVLDFQIALPQVTDKATQSIKDQITEAERFMLSLQKESVQFGKSSIEIKRLEAARLGVLDQAEPLIDKIEKEANALRNAEEAASLYKSQLSKAASIAESMMTDDERFAQTQAELNQLLNMGALDVETYNRALAKAQSQLNKTKDTGKEAFNELDQFAVQAARNLQTSFADALANGLDGFKNFADSAWSIIKNLAAQIASAKILQGVGLGSTLGLSSGTASASGFDMSSLINLGSSAMSSGFGMNGMVGRGISSMGSFFGSNSMSAFGGGLASSEASAFLAAESAGGMGATAAGMGSALGAAAGPLAIAYAGTAILRSIAGDKRMGGGFGKALNAMGDIPILGDFMPVVPLMNSLFGRGPLKQKETFIDAMLGSSGFESGILQTGFKAKGGLFRSDKRDFARVSLLSGMADTDNSALQGFADQLAVQAKGIMQLFNDAAKATSSSLHNVADALGLSTDALDTFQTHISLTSKSGEMLTEQQIADEIARISNEMVHSLVPGIDALSKSGETALQTVSRLGTEFNSLQNAASILSGSMDAAKEAVRALSFEQRTALVDMAGGADALNNKVGFFAENFLSPEQTIGLEKQFLSSELGKLGLSVDMTKDQYKELIMSVTQVGGVSAETANKLLDLAPAFSKYISDLDAFNNSLGTTVDLFANADQLKEAGQKIRQGFFDAVNNAFNDLQRSVGAERTRITNEYNAAIKSTDDQIKLVTDSLNNLKEVSGLIKNSVDALSPMSLEAARSQVQAALSSGNFDSIKLKDAIGVLGQSSTAGLSSALDFQRARAQNLGLLNSLGGAVDTETLRQQQQLDALEASKKLLEEGFKNEMQRLDDIISNAQKQLDALNGLDTSLKSLANALLAFNNAVGAANNPAVLTGNPAISNAEIVNFLKNNGPMDSYNAAIKFGVSSAQIAATGFYTQDQINQFVKDNKLASFDVGGTVPRTGLAMIHKDEQVLTASDSKNMSNVLKNIQRVMETLVVTNNKTERIFRKWDGEGMPAERTA